MVELNLKSITDSLLKQCPSLAGNYSDMQVVSCGTSDASNYMQHISPCDTVTSWQWYYPAKSAREQVQDEILTKVAAAIQADDLKKAKQLLELAKALKEL